MNQPILSNVMTRPPKKPKVDDIQIALQQVKENPEKSQEIAMNLYRKGIKKI